MFRPDYTTNKQYGVQRGVNQDVYNSPNFNKLSESKKTKRMEEQTLEEMESKAPVRDITVQGLIEGSGGGVPQLGSGTTE